jgi:hypothetical protein
MKNDLGSILAVILLFGTVGICVLAGITAYNWIDPETLGGGLLFMGAWALCSYAGYLLLSRLIGLLHKEN